MPAPDSSIGLPARIAASVVTGGLEMLCFHPFDTVAKRLMTSRLQGSSVGSLRNIVFNHHVTAASTHTQSTVSTAAGTMRQRVFSVYQGALLASTYKVLQRLCHFTVQPVTAEAVSRNFQTDFDLYFGENQGKAFIHGLSGSLVGACEVIMTPVDALKIKRQTNPAAFQGRSALDVLRQEKLQTLYRGSSWTLARNIPTAFTLFSVISLVKSSYFGLSGSVTQTATASQNFVASFVGVTCTLLVGNPIDVVKVRVQNQDFNRYVSGSTILRDLIREEGLLALYKGFGVKMLIVAPRLVFAYTIASSLTMFLTDRGTPAAQS